MMFTTFGCGPETIMYDWSGSGSLNGVSRNDHIFGDGRNHKPPADASYLVATYACYSEAKARFESEYKFQKA